MRAFLLSLMLASGDVFPVFAADNPVDGCTCHAVFDGQLLLRYVASRVTLPDESNHLIGKLGVGVAFATAQLPFARRILPVVSLGSKKHVSGVDAGWVVTARTIVADQQAIWDGPVCQLPCHPGSVGAAVFCLPGESELGPSVSVITGPKPAPVRFDNLRPESLCERLDRVSIAQARSAAKAPTPPGGCGRFNKVGLFADFAGSNDLGRLGVEHDVLLTETLCLGRVGGCRRRHVRSIVGEAA